MANLITANNAVGTIDNGLSSTATTLVLNDISNFPILTDVDDYCILTLIRESDGAIEYIRCTSQNVANRSYEVLRAQEGTTALVFLEGDGARNLLTKEQIETLNEDRFNEFYDGFNNSGFISQFTGDIDVIDKTSRYYVKTSVTSGTFPPTDTTDSWSMLETIAQGETSYLQLFFERQGSQQVFIRQKSGGTVFPWSELAKTDNFVSISGNVDNPMQGTFDMGDSRIINAERITIGNNGSNTGRSLQIIASDDSSQSGFSARLIRSQGVNGNLELSNAGIGSTLVESGGALFLDSDDDVLVRSGGSVFLKSDNGLISCDDNRLVNVGNPIAGLDATNKDYVDNKSVGVDKWVRVQNGTTTPTISDGFGVSTIVTTATGKYTLGLTNPIADIRKLAINLTPYDQNSLNIGLCYDRASSTTSSIAITLTGSGGSFTDIQEFVVTIQELT